MPSVFPISILVAMKKIPHQKFSNKIALYSALSVAIGGITKTNGQIIYTDVNPDEGGIGVTSFIDFNQDDQWDAKISQWNNAGIQGALFDVLRPGNAAIAGYASPFGRYSYPYALDFDTLISEGNSHWESYRLYQSMNWGSCNYTNSRWCGVTDKYLGIRFKIGSDNHYGWARLDVTNASNWLLKDYAYNATPNASINAGEGQPLGVDDNYLAKSKVIGLNKSIGIYNLLEATNYKLYNMSGQELMKGIIENKDYVIVATTLPSGVYIVELADTKSSAIIRKKVVLQ